MRYFHALLFTLIVCCASTSYGEVCNYDNSSKEYVENTELVKELYKRGLYIGINKEEARVKYTNLTSVNSYLDSNILEKLFTWSGQTFVCVGEGVAAISYKSHDDYPFMVEYCSLLPKSYVDDSQVYDYIEKTYNLKNMSERVLSDKGIFRFALYHLSYNNRFYSVYVNVYHPVKKPTKSLNITVFDGTYFVNKQKECEARKGANK